MSAIAGMLRLNGAPVAAGEIDALLARMAYRGPDQEGAWIGDGIGLAQASLATTPEARAERQPWREPASGCVVVSDSRFDDRETLIRELGLRDRSCDEVGDGELLIAAWHRWGTGCAARLLGDFAFALWDPRRRSLYCARDAMAVRPLCLHFAPGKLFAFASDARALLALGDIDPSLDEGRIADSFFDYLEAIDETSTMYPAIERLPRAHWLLVEDGRVSRQQYWTPAASRPADLPRDEATWLEGLRAHLDAAVRRRLRGDVAVGSMLSGGLDSSAVVALACAGRHRHGAPALQTFSAIRRLPGCAETAAIRVMAGRFPIDANFVDLDAEESQGDYDRLIGDWPNLAQPWDGSLPLIDQQYSSASRGGVRVMLDGIDADTLLAEGEYMDQLLQARRWRQLWRESRGIARFHAYPGAVLETWRPLISRRLVPDIVRRRIRPLQQARALERDVASSMIDPGFASRSDLAARFERRREAARGLSVEHPAGGARLFIGTATVAGVERYGRLAARHGIEPRHPFLDRDLVEYCAWLPLGLRQRDGWPKWGLRRAMAGVLPNEIAWRADKSHLGSSFAHRLFQRLPVVAPHLGQLDASAARYTHTRALARLPSAGTEGQEEDSRWEQRLQIAILQAWLSTHPGA